MKKPKFFVGIDISSASFTVAVGVEPWKVWLDAVDFENDLDGYTAFHDWLQEHDIQTDQAVLCMEATGVYGEKLAYFVVAQQYQLAVEPPLKVKRAFKPHGHKSDSVDSKQIAEYSFRFLDELHLWQPKAEILEKIKVLLSTREQFTRHKTSHHNQKHALEKKVVWMPLAITLHEESIERIKKQIKQIDKEIRNSINQDPRYGQMVKLLVTMPGVGLLLASNILLIIDSIPVDQLNHKQLAAYIGICPYEKTSGKSVYKPSSSRHYGPARMRKLLYLASLSLRKYNPMFRKYFLRKKAEGKQSKVILNNIANKMLKIMCAIIRTNTPFIEGYRSIHPALLQ